jgi:hypothetical protein
METRTYNQEEEYLRSKTTFQQTLIQIQNERGLKKFAAQGLAMIAAIEKLQVKKDFDIKFYTLVFQTVEAHLRHPEDENLKTKCENLARYEKHGQPSLVLKSGGILMGLLSALFLVTGLLSKFEFIKLSSGKENTCLASAGFWFASGLTFFCMGSRRGLSKLQKTLAEQEIPRFSPVDNQEPLLTIKTSGQP